jgi:hypothetical protein
MPLEAFSLAPRQTEDLKMSFVEMTNEEWEAVYKQHDALIRMAELEMRAEIRETAAEPNRSPLQQSAEPVMHEL